MKIILFFSYCASTFGIPNGMKTENRVLSELQTNHQGKILWFSCFCFMGNWLISMFKHFLPRIFDSVRHKLIMFCEFQHDRGWIWLAVIFPVSFYNRYCRTRPEYDSVFNAKSWNIVFNSESELQWFIFKAWAKYSLNK